MSPVSLSASSLTWVNLPCLLIGIAFCVIVHGAWTITERRFFPVGDVE